MSDGNGKDDKFVPISASDVSDGNPHAISKLFRTFQEDIRTRIDMLAMKVFQELERIERSDDLRMTALERRVEDIERKVMP